MLVSNMRTPENSIGLLRLLLAGAVLWGHAWYLTGRATEEPFAHWLLADRETMATFAVKAFFVLSGFLVMQSAQRLSSPRRFLWHRLLRIYPGFWACLLVTAILLPAATWGICPKIEANWVSAADYVRANWLRFYEQPQIENLLTQSAPHDDLNGSLWTLPYEIGCYVVLGFFSWVGLLKKQSFSIWMAGISWLALYLHDILWPATAWFFKSEGRLLCIWFVSGTIAANLPDSFLRGLRGWRAALAAATVYLAACRFGGLAVVGPIAITALVLSLAWSLPGRDFETRVGGDYSYGIYIYAYPVQQCLISVGLLRYGMVLYIGLVAVITMILAYGSWHLIEKRALALKSIGEVRPNPLALQTVAT